MIPCLILKPKDRPMNVNLSPQTAHGMGLDLLGPQPHSGPSPAHPHRGLGSPGVKWCHLEGDDLSAACAQGPDDLMAHWVCGTSVEKTKAGATHSGGLCSFPLSLRALGSFCPRALENAGKGKASWDSYLLWKSKQVIMIRWLLILCSGKWGRKGGFINNLLSLFCITEKSICFSSAI